jgi:hypothetical protein
VTRHWPLPGGEPSFERCVSALSGSELSGSELSSVLLEVMQRRAAARTPADVLAQYHRDGFCRPAATDQRVSVAIDAHLLAAADTFDAIELSPVAPLAACSAMGRTSQNRVLSALRSTELVADPTNVLALECAAQMRAGAAAVDLATSQRVVRAQPIPKLPGYAPHFRIFVLGSGGIETKDHAFTLAALERHIRTMLAALDRLERHGYAFGARRVDLLATPERAALADRLADTLGSVAARKPLEHPYYSGGLRYMLWVTASDGDTLPLIDGGSFDWLAQLTSNRRAVYIASGAGSQLIALRFRAHTAA